MPRALEIAWRAMSPFLRFAWYVAREFYKNNGILMAGALGYNALISLVPLVALFFVVASNFADETMILAVIHAELTLILPGEADQFTEAFASVLKDTTLLGGIGLAVLIFFSSIGFRMLQSAMGVIFRHHRPKQKRHWLISLIIPLGYVFVISLAMIAITVVQSIIDATSWTSIQILLWNIPMEQWNTWWLSGVGYLALGLVFTSFYKFLPEIKVRWQLAVIGGFVAATLWEIVRQGLVYYFANISMINVVYGSLATIIIIMFAMEVAGAILLLGAQVISNLEQNQIAGRPWSEDPIVRGVKGALSTESSGLMVLVDD